MTDYTTTENSNILEGMCAYEPSNGTIALIVSTLPWYIQCVVFLSYFSPIGNIWRALHFIWLDASVVSPSPRDYIKYAPEVFYIIYWYNFLCNKDWITCCKKSRFPYHGFGRQNPDGTYEFPFWPTIPYFCYTIELFWTLYDYYMVYDQMDYRVIVWTIATICAKFQVGQYLLQIKLRRMHYIVGWNLIGCLAIWLYVSSMLSQDIKLQFCPLGRPDNSLKWVYWFQSWNAAIMKDPQSTKYSPTYLTTNFVHQLIRFKQPNTTAAKWLAMHAKCGWFVWRQSRHETRFCEAREPVSAKKKWIW
jgi:hypothetical protein